MSGTNVIATVLVALGALLLGVGIIMVVWRPWKQRQAPQVQVQDRASARQEELDELAHEYRVEVAKGIIHDARVYFHAVKPTYDILRSVDDAVGYQLTEETIKPLVGFVVEQAVKETFESATTASSEDAIASSPATTASLPAAHSQGGRKSIWKRLKEAVLFMFIVWMVVGGLLMTTMYYQDKAAYEHSNKPVGNIIQYSVHHMSDMFP